MNKNTHRLACGEYAVKIIDASVSNKNNTRVITFSLEVQKGSQRGFKFEKTVTVNEQKPASMKNIIKDLSCVGISFSKVSDLTDMYLLQQVVGTDVVIAVKEVKSTLTGNMIKWPYFRGKLMPVITEDGLAKEVTPVVVKQMPDENEKKNLTSASIAVIGKLSSATRREVFEGLNQQDYKVKTNTWHDLSCVLSDKNSGFIKRVPMTEPASYTLTLKGYERFKKESETCQRSAV